MQLCHTSRATSAVFDDPNLVSSAGLVPVVALARSAGLHELAQQHLTVPTDKGANAGLKVASLVAGMVAGADSIDDMALLRHGGMGRVFANAYAPSTLGSFLRSFTFGHVRQLDAVASRFLTRLADQAPLIAASPGSGGRVMVDIDDTIIEVHGYAKQGSGYGYSGVRGLNALLATVSTHESAPVVVAQRLRKGSCGSPRGAKRLVADALKATASLSTAKPLVRADSAFYGRPMVAAALREGADVSVTVRLDPKVRATIATIGEDAWTPIEYTDAVFDEQSNTWVSRAEVAEVPFTAFSSRRQAERVPGRLVVRRIPDLNPAGKQGQGTLFDTWRFHAFFTTTEARRGRHRGRGQDPPRSRDHRAGPRRSEARRASSPALGQVRRQLGLAGPGRDRVQPDPRGSNPDRTDAGQVDHRHHPPQADQRASPGRVLRAASDPAPTPALAMGARLDRTVHPSLRTTTSTHDLNTQPATARPRTPWTTWQQGQALAPAHTHPTTLKATPTPQTQLIGGSRLRRGVQFGLSPVQGRFPFGKTLPWMPSLP